MVRSGGEVRNTFRGIVGLKRLIFELGAVISDQVTIFFFRLVFDEREKFLKDVFDFGFIGEELHPDIVGETVYGMEEILETRLGGWSDWTTNVNVNVVELLGGGGVGLLWDK
jgi:hypothetical protein